jgi:hypothetical protein
MVSNSQRSSSSGYYWLHTLTGIVAFVVSYALHKSIWWGVLHWFFGVWYVLYAIIAYNSQIGPAVKALFGF